MSIKIIAEAGVNHNGSIEIAKRLVDKAKDAGADYVKFQTFKTEKIVSKNAKKAYYQTVNTKNDDSQFSMLKKLELGYEDFTELKRYCEQKGIIFLSSAFDFDSIDFLDHIGVKEWKIPSGEITNLPYLEKIARLHKPVIISTGMATLQEIGNAVKILKKNGASEITILHCTSEYPAPLDDVNLLCLRSMKKKFNVPIGYSDHTQGIEIALAAAALGAVVLEKHFTLDRTMDGPDHKASIEVQELKVLVDGVRKIERALGNGIKQPSPSERKNISIVRKSIVAACDIKAGEIFTDKNLACKRPGDGISPMNWYSVLGKKAKYDFAEDELIKL